MERLVEVVSIKTRRKAVIGHEYRIRSFDQPMPSPVTPGDEIAQYIDDKFETKISPIERICFRHASGYVEEKFMTIDPRDKEEITLLIDKQEANRFKEAKMNVEQWLDKERKLLSSIKNQGWITRLKWVFTGIRLGEEE